MGGFNLKLRSIAKESGLLYNLYMRVSARRFHTASRMCRYLAVCVALCALSLAADEAPTPAPAAPAGLKSGSLGTPQEIAEWQLDIAQSSYEVTKTDRNLTSVITALERLIGLYCMPNLSKTLQHNGFPSDPQCIKYMDAAFALDAENPVATCARDGIDSRSCSEAYAAQETNTYSELYPIWPTEPGSVSDLDLALDVRTADPQLTTLGQELSRLESRSLQSADARKEVLPRMRQAFSEALGLACKNTKLKVQTLFGDLGSKIGTLPSIAMQDQGFRNYLLRLPPAEREEALLKAKQAEEQLQRPGQGQSSSPMDDLVKGLKPTPVNANRVVRVRADGVLRTRYLSSICDDTLTRALRADPGSAAASCARYGDSSPDCIKAKRRERAEAVRQLAPRKDAGSAQSAPKGPKQNFSTF